MTKVLDVVLFIGRNQDIFFQTKGVFCSGRQEHDHSAIDRGQMVLPSQAEPTTLWTLIDIQNINLVFWTYLRRY